MERMKTNRIHKAAREMDENQTTKETQKFFYVFFNKSFWFKIYKSRRFFKKVTKSCKRNGKNITNERRGLTKWHPFFVLWEKVGRFCLYILRVIFQKPILKIPFFGPQQQFNRFNQWWAKHPKYDQVIRARNFIRQLIVDGLVTEVKKMTEWNGKN